MSLPPLRPPEKSSKPIRPVVSCLVRNEDQILILRRSDKVGSFRQYWSCVSGYVEKNEKPSKTAVREVSEETCIPPSLLQLLRSAGPFYSEVDELIFESHWFLFESLTRKIDLDWEHDEYDWISPLDLPSYKSVPWLSALASVLLDGNSKGNESPS